MFLVILWFCLALNLLLYFYVLVVYFFVGYDLLIILTTKLYVVKAFNAITLA